jgi:segregation and condensation protein B
LERNAEPEVGAGFAIRLPGFEEFDRVQTHMSLKPQLEAIVYATETPVTLEQIVPLVKNSVVAEHGALEDAEIKSRVRAALEELVAEYAAAEHGIEIRQVAGGYRMSTKPEQHDVVRGFAKSLKPPIRLSLPALETLAVIAYKQPATVPEISEIRGVDSGGVIATLLERKLITTAGRKAVIGRPILYKTTKEFLLRFGLKDVNELPSMEEFEKLVQESFQSEMMPAEDATVAENVSAQESVEADAAANEPAEDEPAEDLVAPGEHSEPHVVAESETETLEDHTAEHEKSA